jgi:hypothetical protein
MSNTQDKSLHFWLGLATIIYLATGNLNTALWWFAGGMIVVSLAAVCIEAGRKS